jgi:DNA-binding transcriptional MerR regulator
MAKTGAAQLITPKQCADMIEVSPATLRRYAKSFKKHLSKSAKGKRRQYTQQDLAVLTQAKNYIRGGTSIKRTNKLLGSAVVDEVQSFPLAATMSHAELVSSVDEMKQGFVAAMNEVQTAFMDNMKEAQRNKELIDELLEWKRTVEARSFIDRLLNRVPAKTD